GSHVRACAACRQRLEDLHAIRQALAAAPVVDAPPAGDWSGFMRRLDAAVSVADEPAEPAVVLERRSGRWTVRQLVAIAALLAIAAMGVFMAARARSPRPAAVVAGNVPPPTESSRDSSPAARSEKGDKALRESSAEHLERSKLVVLGLATRDPRQTR